MRKRIIFCLSIILAAAILFGCAKKPAAQTNGADPANNTAGGEASAAMANPVIEVASYNELCEAVPAVKLADAPEGADEVRYSYINMAPIISQIMFSYGGNEYTYRAAVCEGSNAQTDISGVYDPLENEENNSNDGGSYRLRSSKTKTMGLTEWYDDTEKCQYSLFTPTGCDVNQQIEDVTDLLMQSIAARKEENEPKTPQNEGEVQGKLLEINDNDMVVTLDDGSTSVFLLTHMDNISAKSGDTIKLSYSGDLKESPEALSVTVLDSASAELVLNGTISQIDPGIVYIKTETGNVYGFTLSENTKYSGASNSLKIGNIVSAGYSGDLNNMPTALEINTVVVGKDAPDPLVNKSVKGVVKTLKTKSITVSTDNGRDYTFIRSSETRIKGDYDLRSKAHVKITYDGYASKSPVAKIITVLAPPDPTPPKPTPTYSPAQYYTVSGVILVRAGNALSIQDAYGRVFSFLLGSPQISGDGYPGDTATVTFYVDASGSNVVTKIVYRSNSPIPAPTTEPAPTTQPIVTRTVYGVVVMQAGNALSVQDNSGTIFSFLLGAPEIVGKGGVGDYVTVTYQDMGTRVNATKIVYHNIDYTVTQPGPVYDFYGQPTIGQGAAPASAAPTVTSFDYNGQPAIGQGATVTSTATPTPAYDFYGNPIGMG